MTNITSYDLPYNVTQPIELMQYYDSVTSTAEVYTLGSGLFFPTLILLVWVVVFLAYWRSERQYAFVIASLASFFTCMAFLITMIVSMWMFLLCLGMLLASVAYVYFKPKFT